jgi:hypothetical protein
MKAPLTLSKIAFLALAAVFAVAAGLSDASARTIKTQAAADAYAQADAGTTSENALFTRAVGNIR